MKAVIQRVSRASVSVAGETVGEIGTGYLVLLGVGEESTHLQAEKLADKIAKLRIFADEAGKINRGIADVGGEMLVISQFTLYADCSKNRPSFTKAAPAAIAQELYEHFIAYSRGLAAFKKVESGVFGAVMQVELMNEGPFTVLL
ncbi:MAG: D-aminoacyl-tRNA deacylase, partial [Oscillospiraceae bacterium]|nr:D-aminoacyl-tRNA deacylase [Oscillospiraceae bacterium]